MATLWGRLDQDDALLPQYSLVTCCYCLAPWLDHHRHHAYHYLHVKPAVVCWLSVMMLSMKSTNTLEPRRIARHCLTHTHTHAHGAIMHLLVVMARYSHEGHDTIRYDITQDIAIRYDIIRSKSASPYVRNRKHAGNSAQHWSTVVLPMNTVAAAGARIVAVRRGDGRGRPARRPTVGGRCSLKSRVIQQGYCEYCPPNHSSWGDSPQLLLFGGRTAGGRSHSSNI